MTTFRFGFFILISLALNGCYMAGSITAIEDPLPAVVFNKSNSLESVAGSSGYVTTPISGFRIKHSAGLLTNRQFSSTPNGFKVFLHVNGQMTSEEEEQ